MSNTEEQEKAHYFLSSMTVVGMPVKGGNGQARWTCNIMTVKPKNYISRKDIAMSQQSAMNRFVNEIDQKQDFQIIDVEIGSISYLGHMTKAEFHEGFDIPEEVTPQAVAEAELSQEEQDRVR